MDVGGRRRALYGGSSGLAALIGCAAVFAFAAPGAGAHPVPAAVHHGGALQAVLGDDFELTADGLFRVRLPSGGSLLTHGPDSRAAMNELDGDGALPAGTASRQPVCAADYYQHVLYGRIAGSPDLSSSHVPMIRSAMNQANALLAADSVASGGITADYKVLCDETGQVRVDSFEAPSMAFADVVAAAKAAGFKDPRADYTIFFDALSPACGIGSYAIDSSLAAENRSNGGGGYGISYQGCWLDETPMHENAHNQGAVQPDAPNSTGLGGHCNEEGDVLCYSPDGGDRNQGGLVSRCGMRVTFDCGDDDYFDTAPEPGEYLASNWNLGSALNRFIVFGQGSPIGPASSGNQVDPPCSQRDCAVPISEDRPERTGYAAETGGWSFYRVAVPRKLKRLIVKLRAVGCDPAAGCDTDLDLYARARRPPSETSYDCRSRGRGSVEKCRVRRPRGKRYYVGVKSVNAEAGASFTIRTRTRP